MNLIEFEVNYKDDVYYYGIDLLQVDEGIKTGVKLTKYFGDSIANVKSFSGDFLDQQIGPIIAGIIYKIDAQELIDLKRTLLKNLKKRNEKGEYIPFDLETEFKGKFALLCKVLGQIIKYNYEDFFLMLKDAFSGEGVAGMSQTSKQK